MGDDALRERKVEAGRRRLKEFQARKRAGPVCGGGEDGKETSRVPTDGTSGMGFVTKAITAVDPHVEMLMREKQEMSVEIDVQRSEIDMLTTQKAELESAMRDALMHAERTRRAVDDEQSKREEAERIVIQRDQTVEQLKADYEFAQRNHESCVEALEELRQGRADLEVTTKAQKRALDQKAEEADELKSVIRENTLRMVSLQEEAEEQRKSGERALQEKIAAEARLEELMGQLSQEHEQLDELDRLRIEQSGLYDKLEGQARRIEQTTDENRKLLRRVREQEVLIQQYKAERSGPQGTDLSNLTLELDNLRRKLKEEEQRLLELEKAKQVLEEHLAGQQTRIKTVVQENEDLSLQLESLERTQEERLGGGYRDPRTPLKQVIGEMMVLSHGETPFHTPTRSLREVLGEDGEAGELRPPQPAFIQPLDRNQEADWMDTLLAQRNRLEEEFRSRTRELTPEQMAVMSIRLQEDLRGLEALVHDSRDVGSVIARTFSVLNTLFDFLPPKDATDVSMRRRRVKALV
eukprot:TRINITY_DN2065_c0_g1_i3.p1 TRINITY_DN2065_c0_g1~~TRINITY_DN2065_c0_g1_i3.p1  ORF type:complete len:533 (-),score=111.97 TRINITY_DN2065_c0_g1_i3:4-1572(-)